MKKSLHTIIALCIGMMIGMTTTAFGAGVKEYVQASFKKINFVVNGDNVQLDADPLVYQGSTYLPVRTVMNALGYDVCYLADSKTVVANIAPESLMPANEPDTKKEGDQVNNVEDKTVEEEIKQLNEQLELEQERLSQYEKTVQELKSNPKLSEEDKKWAIDLRQPIIDSTKEKISNLQKKLSELKN